MKILVFTTYFYPHIGGLEKNVFELFSRLAKDYKCEVDIITCNTENTACFERREGLNIYRVKCWTILNNRYAIPNPWSLISTLRHLKRRPDIISTQTRFYLTSFFGLLHAKCLKIPIIHTERGSGYAVYPNKFVELTCWLYDQTLGRKLFMRAATVVGVSMDVCRFVRRMGARRCHLIFNGIDCNFWKQVKTERTKYGTADKDFIITYVGRLLKEKGPRLLIEAIKDINRQDFKLLIVGDGAFKTTLFKLVRKYRLDDTVMLLGEKSTSEIREILSITDIFVNPSYYKEGLPTTILEAGSVGVPIIATDVSGVKEVIDHNENGVIINQKDVAALRDSILYLEANPQLRKKFREELPKKIRTKFSWEQTAKEYFALMQDCVSKESLL